MQRRKSKKSDSAVSPVVGVMLMLVVTIIIAAIVATMAGGLITTQKATPSASFDVELTTDSLEITALSLSDEIPSKDIKIVLSKPGAIRTLVANGDTNNTAPFGFNIVETGAKGFKDQDSVSDALADPTISQTQAANESNKVQWFGNYTLKSGSRMSASGNAFDLITPSGLSGFTQYSFTKYEILGWTESQWTSVFGDTVTTTPIPLTDLVLKFNVDSEITDPSLAAYFISKGVATDTSGTVKLDDTTYAEAADTNWSFGQTCVYGDGLGAIDLEAGDSVTVMIVYLPSGQTLFTKTVTVGA